MKKIRLTNVIEFVLFSVVSYAIFSCIFDLGEFIQKKTKFRAEVQWDRQAAMQTGRKAQHIYYVCRHAESKKV